MSVVSYSYSPEWNSGARTIAGLLGDGNLTFSVGQSVGIVCGFNSTDNNQNYLEIQHGFYISNKKYKIVESGSFKTAFSWFASDAVFKIARAGTTVRYYVDDVLVYTSLVPSSGVVFGDCSLFAYLDTIIDATITVADGVNEAEILLPFGASGVEGDINYAAIGLGPFAASGEELEVNSASIGIGPILVSGVEGDASWGAVGLGPLTAEGTEDSLIPDYSAGVVALGPVYAYGYEGAVDSTEAAISLGPVWAVGAEGNPSWGSAGLGPAYAFGYSLKSRYLVADWPAWTVDIRSTVAPTYITSTASLNWPNRTLSADGESVSATAALTWPARSLAAYGGGSATLTWPVRVLAAAGTTESIGTAELTWSTRSLSATAVTGGVGAAELTWPSRSATAYGGGSAALTWPVRTLTVGGTLEIIGTAALAFPVRTLTADGLSGGVGTVAANWPIRTLTANGLTGGIGTAALAWPVRTLTVTVAGSGVATETTYAVNLSTGAVTQLLLGAFDKLVTAHGRLYGLRAGALVRLDGDLDGAATIPATIRFAPQQFGTLHLKRLDGQVYLNLRENDGVTLTVVQDETTSWDYQTATDNAPALGTHRIKVGRGVVFHSLGLTLKNRNGGRLDVGGLELTILPLSRKLK